MPLIRAFGRWLRQHSTDDTSAARPLEDAPVTAMARTWFVVLVAVLAVVPIVVAGSAYEGVRALDRPNALGRRGRWIAAVGIAVLIGALLVWLVTRAA
jgi:hypothetical protein